MKTIVTILTIAFWLAALYFGFTFIVTKTMGSASEQKKSADDLHLEKEQSQKAQENLKKKKRLMEERERTLRYHQNR